MIEDRRRLTLTGAGEEGPIHQGVELFASPEVDAFDKRVHDQCTPATAGVARKLIASRL